MTHPPLPCPRRLRMYSPMLRTQQWKLLGHRKEMYELATDPAERVDRWDTDPGVHAELEERARRLTYSDRELRDRLKAADAASGPSAAGLAESEIQELESLGYL